MGTAQQIHTLEGDNLLFANQGANCTRMLCTRQFSRLGNSIKELRSSSLIGQAPGDAAVSRETVVSPMLCWNAHMVRSEPCINQEGLVTITLDPAPDECEQPRRQHTSNMPRLFGARQPVTPRMNPGANGFL